MFLMQLNNENIVFFQKLFTLEEFILKFHILFVGTLPKTSNSGEESSTNNGG